jgi:hypothetical protein
MEHYQESMNSLADRLNKKRIIVPHENISQREIIPSISSIQKFKENSKFEYALYESVKKANGFK